MKRIASIAALAATALMLAGCISLFPKAKPVQLYNFTPAAPAAAAGKPAATVLRGPTAFTRPAASDRILTRNGAETAYIAQARWAAPAQVLFDEALSQAFDASGVRLATRSEPGGMAAMLRLEVRSFEARYVNGSEAAPTVVVEARATLTSLEGRSLIDSRVFRAEKAASENRVAPMVDAYQAATADLLGQVATWTAGAVGKR